MEYTKLSPKQFTAMNWWAMPEYESRDAVICDGSIRSGKTVAMSVGFVLWSCTCFDNQLFAFCGKTIDALRRNVIFQLPRLLEGIASVKENRSKNYLEIVFNGHRNTYFMFGGKDESSASLIQGVTLAGVMFDEVALMPRSFVEQAIGRCSVSGSRIWFNCNPEHPEHWFRKEWIQKSREKNALHIHFLMNDNYSLDPKIRERYERQFDGVFYERFILGKWVKAEGLVYPMFDAKQHVTDDWDNGTKGVWYISIDYGTVNPFSAGLWKIQGSKAIRTAEYYFNSREEKRQMTDEEYYAEVEKLADGHYIEKIIADPSAASFIETVRRHGKFSVKKARNDVMNGIRVTSALLNGGFLLFDSSCKDIIREFGLYSWDDKAVDDKVLKEFDHAMDDMRYFCYTVLRKEYKWLRWDDITEKGGDTD